MEWLINGIGLEAGDGKARKKHFTDVANRKAVELKDKELSMEFSNGLLGTSSIFTAIYMPASRVSLCLTHDSSLTYTSIDLGPY